MKQIVTQAARIDLHLGWHLPSTVVSPEGSLLYKHNILVYWGAGVGFWQGL